jgi:hypothetical protein
LSVDKSGQVATTKAVVNVDDPDATGTGVEHGEESGEATKASAVADTGGDGDDGAGDEAADNTGQGALHASDGDNDVGRLEDRQMGQQAVEACHTDIVVAGDGVAHDLGGQGSLFSNRQVAGACGQDYNARFPGPVVAFEPDHPRFGVEVKVGDERAGRLEVDAGGAGGEEAGRALGEASDDGSGLVGGLAGAVDNLREALAQPAMGVERGEVADDLEGQAAQVGDGFVNGSSAAGDVGEQGTESLFCHGRSIGSVAKNEPQRADAVALR